MKYSKKIFSISEPVGFRQQKYNYFVHGRKKKSLGFQQMPESEPG